MSRIKNQKTFHSDGFKRVLCPNCGRIIGETHLGEKNMRTVKCKKCKNRKTIAPPREGYVDSQKVFFWSEENDSCWTADLR